MTAHHHDQAAAAGMPPVVERLLRRLERVTGRVSMASAVTFILATGVLLTAAIVAAVHWVENRRTLSEFDADVGRIQLLVQDRLDYRAALVQQVTVGAAEQVSSTAANGMRTTTWSTSGVTVLPARPWYATELANLLGTSEAQGEALLNCIKTGNAAALSLCGEVKGEAGSEGRFLISPIMGGHHGWVTVLLEDADLLRTPFSNSTWRFRTKLLGNQAVASDSLAADHFPWRRARSVTVAGQTLTLQIEGQALPRTWEDLLQRQTGMWVAGVSGLICTIVFLHMYMMLVSTRRRANDMAKEMASALQRTQSRNQAVMDTAPDAILMTDAEGLVRWCNQATTSIFGENTEDLVGSRLNQILPSLGDDGTHETWFNEHGFSDRVIAYETMGCRKDGTAFPVAISASRTEREGALIQTFIVRDTTDAKWAEQELLLRNRALASSPNGVVITSMTLPSQPVIYVNKAFEDITGYTSQEIEGLNCKLLNRKDSKQAGLDTIRAAIKQGRACQVVLRNYRKDGSMFYNDLAISPVQNPDGVVTHYVGVQTDITDRIAAETVLRLRTERLHAVFDLSPDGFVVFDKRGEVSIVNPAFERMTGLLAANLVGQSQQVFEEQLMHRCTSTEVDQGGAGEVGEAGETASRDLLHLHTPCTRTLLRRVRHGGHDREIVMYFRDLTHELEVDRMKSEFLSMAAHELRTPMASIFGFTELLLKRPLDEAKRKDILQTMYRQSQILINLVNELLDLARIESRRGKDFKRETQRLQPIIEETLMALLVQGDERLVDYALPSEPILVDVDREKFSQALTNVLSNAYKYSPQGGTIKLDVISRATGTTQQCGVRVTDHGIGMTSAQLSKVFDRFFRAETSGNIPGTGLGMTIVKEIIELHGGEVTVASEFGQGSVVTLWLPIYAHHPASAAPLVNTGALKD